LKANCICGRPFQRNGEEGGEEDSSEEDKGDKEDKNQEVDGGRDGGNEGEERETIESRELGKGRKTKTIEKRGTTKMGKIRKGRAWVARRSSGNLLFTNLFQQVPNHSRWVL